MLEKPPSLVIDIRLWRDVLVEAFLFMQDNDLLHTSRVTKNASKTVGVVVLDWPACYLDLNPIE